MSFFIGTPHTRNAGYFYNDDRPSGGIKREDDVKTCPHCQAVILMREWQKVSHGTMNGGFCQQCNAPICPHCTSKFATEGCIPFIEQLEKAYDMTVKLKQYLKIAGLEPASPQPIFTGILHSK